MRRLTPHPYGVPLQGRVTLASSRFSGTCFTSHLSPPASSPRSIWYQSRARMLRLCKEKKLQSCLPLERAWSNASGMLSVSLHCWAFEWELMLNLIVHMCFRLPSHSSFLGRGEHRAHQQRKVCGAVLRRARIQSRRGCFLEPGCHGGEALTSCCRELTYSVPNRGLCTHTYINLYRLPPNGNPCGT